MRNIYKKNLDKFKQFLTEEDEQKFNDVRSENNYDDEDYFEDVIQTRLVIKGKLK